MFFSFNCTDHLPAWALQRPPPPPSSLRGLSEGPGRPWRPVALSPGSQGDLAAPSPGLRAVMKGLGAVLISPWPGGTWCRLQQPDSIKTACLHNVLSVRFYGLAAGCVRCLQYMSRIRPLTLTDAVNHSLSFRLNAAQRRNRATVPRIMCFLTTFSMVFALFFTCGEIA